MTLARQELFYRAAAPVIPQPALDTDEDGLTDTYETAQA